VPADEVIHAAPQPDSFCPWATRALIAAARERSARRRVSPGPTIKLIANGARPGLSITAAEDHLAGTDEQRRRASARAGAEIAELDGLAHWWFTQDPQRAAAIINRSGQNWDKGETHKITISKALYTVTAHLFSVRDRRRQRCFRLSPNAI